MANNDDFSKLNTVKNCLILYYNLLKNSLAWGQARHKCGVFDNA